MTQLLVQGHEHRFFTKKGRLPKHPNLSASSLRGKSQFPDHWTSSDTLGMEALQMCPVLSENSAIKVGPNVEKPMVKTLQFCCLFFNV